MAVEEQIFHYSQGLKNRIRVEIERSEVAALPEAMRIADRMDSLFNNHRGTFIFNNGPGSGPVPMEIRQIPQTYRYKNKRPNAAERTGALYAERLGIGHPNIEENHPSIEEKMQKTKQTVTVSRHWRRKHV